MSFSQLLGYTQQNISNSVVVSNRACKSLDVEIIDVTDIVKDLEET